MTVPDAGSVGPASPPRAAGGPLADDAWGPSRLGAPGSRRRLTAEVWIVLGLSLGKSGVYAIVRIIDRLTAEVALGDQSTAMNPSLSPRPWLDLTYQLLSIGFALVPVALALYLLSANGARKLLKKGPPGGVGESVGVRWPWAGASGAVVVRDGWGRRGARRGCLGPSVGLLRVVGAAPGSDS